MFDSYIREFARMFNAEVRGEDKPMQAATNAQGLTIVNFGMGSSGERI